MNAANLLSIPLTRALSHESIEITKKPEHYIAEIRNLKKKIKRNNITSCCLISVQRVTQLGILLLAGYGCYFLADTGLLGGVGKLLITCSIILTPVCACCYCKTCQKRSTAIMGQVTQDKRRLSEVEAIHSEIVISETLGEKLPSTVVELILGYNKDTVVC